MFSAGLGLLGLAGQQILHFTGDVSSGLLSLAFDILLAVAFMSSTKPMIDSFAGVHIQAIRMCAVSLLRNTIIDSLRNDARRQISCSSSVDPCKPLPWSLAQ
jgi:hypothetical protein